MVILYGVLSAIIKSRAFKIVLKTYACCRDGREVCFSVLEKLGTVLYGVVGKVVCLHELSN